jgi:hypothetical protein
MGSEQNLNLVRDLYESHITVDSAGQQDMDRFKEVCSKINVKPILIILPVGQYPSQLMTAKFHRGEYDEVVKEVYNIGSVLSGEGFKVTRHKLEAMVMENSHIPLTDEQAKKDFPGTYFEFHIKVTDPDTKLEEICKANGVHLSRNASSIVSGKTQNFITARYPSVGRASAEEKFGQVIGILKEKKYSLTHLIKEFTILDDNKQIDAGWAEPLISSCYGNCGLTCPVVQNI